MKRSLLVLIAMLLAAAALGGGSYLLSRRLCVSYIASSMDDLDWLRREFGLTEAQMQRVRALHEGYLPRCREFCARIEEKQVQLQTVMASNPGVTPEVKEKLSEVAALRAQCQANMLEHFYEASQAIEKLHHQRLLLTLEEFVAAPDHLQLTLGFP